MKFLILAALVAVAVADYHDDTFHFSTTGLTGVQKSAFVQASPVLAKQTFVAQPTYQQYQTVKQVAAPVYTQQYAVKQVAQPAYTQYAAVAAPAYTQQYAVKQVAQPAYTQYAAVAAPAYTQQYAAVAAPAYTQQYAAVAAPAYTQYAFAQPAYTQQYAVKQVAQPAYTQQYTAIKSVVAKPVVAKPVYTAVKKIAQPVYTAVAQPAYTQQIAVKQVAKPVAVSQYSQYADSVATYANNYNAPQFRILSQVQEADPESGAYKLAFSTENGIQATEQGSLVNSAEGPAVAAQGSYSYTGTDGQVYTVNYVADENGFRASGDHLPTPPPIPAEILRSLEENAASGEQYDDEGRLIH